MRASTHPEPGAAIGGRTGRPPGGGPRLARALRGGALALVAATATWAAPTPAAAYQLLRERSQFGAPKSAPFIAPNRLFQLDIGPPWQPMPPADHDPDTVQFQLISAEGSALFRVHRRPVGEGARAKQLLVKALDERLKKLPHFETVLRRDVLVNGIKAASITGTFWYQGNAQYPRTVEEVYLVFGRDAFELHFECFSPLGPHLAPQLDRIYQSFQPRPSGETPSAPTDDDDPIETDDLPF